MIQANKADVGGGFPRKERKVDVNSTQIGTAACKTQTLLELGFKAIFTQNQHEPNMIRSHIVEREKDKTTKRYSLAYHDASSIGLFSDDWS